METLKLSDYITTVRSAHDLAEALRREHPHLRAEIDQLQSIVARTQQKLDFSVMRYETASALCELEAAYQTLQNLRHRPKN